MDSANRELPGDMRLSNRSAIVHECGAGDHPHDLLSANVLNTWACRRHAAAETNGVLDAAALVYWLDPWRARPPYKREEKVTLLATTSLPPLLLHVPSTQCCKCCRAAAVLTARQVGHDHQSCSMAPAPACRCAGQRHSGQRLVATAADPCSIEPLMMENGLRGSPL